MGQQERPPLVVWTEAPGWFPEALEQECHDQVLELLETWAQAHPERQPLPDVLVASWEVH